MYRLDRDPFTIMLSVALLVLAALAGAPAAFASPNQLELTPYVAYRFGGEIEDQDDFFGDNTTDIDESEAFGVTLDIPLDGGFKLELLVSQQDSEAQFDEGLFEPSFELGDIKVTYAHVGLLYEWQPGDVRPFVVGSAGATVLDPDFPAADEETKFSIAFGGGVKVFLSEHIGLRLEGRGFWTAVDEDEDRYYDYGDNGDVLFQGEASVGLILAW